MKIDHLCEFAAALADELKECVQNMDESEAQRFYQDVKNAPRIFVWAPGRCQAVLRCFVIRLVHLGVTAYVVGDTTTPAICEGDLLIVASGAGHNVGVASIAQRARGFGATVALLTIVPESLCQRASSYTVIIPGATAALGGIGHSIQPGGGKYEASMLLFLDAVIARLNQDLGGSLNGGIRLHANLE